MSRTSHPPTQSTRPHGPRPTRAHVGASAKRTPKVIGTDPLDAYLLELRGADQLSREDELELVQAIDSAWRTSFRHIVEAGIGLPELVAIAERVHDERIAPTQLAHDARDETAAGPVAMQLLRAAEGEERMTDARARLAQRSLTGATRTRVRKALCVAIDQRSRALGELNLRREHYGPMVERVRDALEVIASNVKRADRGDRHAAKEARVGMRSLGTTKAAGMHLANKLRSELRSAERAKTELVTANLRLVVSFAKKYGGRGVALGDLIQEGNISLMRAADKYDYRVGTKFSTYAAWWLRQAMQRAVISHGRTVRLPVHVAASRARAARKSYEMSQHLGRAPDAMELAIELGETVERVRETMEAGRIAVSIDAPISDDGRLKLSDVMADDASELPDDAAFSEERKAYTSDALSKLNAREQRILKLRFGMDGLKPHTLNEIGQELNLTRERIRQIEAVALKKLRRVMSVRTM